MCAHPSVKRVPGLVLTGEQSALAVPHGPLTVLVGLRMPTPAVGGTVSTPASSLPGLQEIASHRHIVPALCTGVLACQVRVTLVVAKRLCFAFAFMCVSQCV